MHTQVTTPKIAVFVELFESLSGERRAGTEQLR
jgi:hypothetical protein